MVVITEDLPTKVLPEEPLTEEQIELIDYLLRVRGILETNWTKGHTHKVYADGSSRHCLVGAVDYCLAGPDSVDIYTRREGVSIKVLNLIDRVIQEDYLYHVKERYPFVGKSVRLAPGEITVLFNDGDQTMLQHVLDVVDKSIEMVRSGRT